MEDAVKLGLILGAIVLAIYLLPIVIGIALVAGVLFLIYALIRGSIDRSNEKREKAKYHKALNARIEVITSKKDPLFTYENRYEDLNKKLYADWKNVRRFSTYDDCVDAIKDLKERCAFIKYKCEYCGNMIIPKKKFLVNIDLMEINILKNPPKDALDLKIITSKKWLACSNSSIEETVECQNCGHKISGGINLLKY